MAKLDSHLLIPNKKWTSVQWIDSYDSLKSFFGAKHAKTAWLESWHKRGSTDANTSDFRSKMKERGIEIPAGSIGGSLLDTGSGAFDSLGSVLKIGGTMAILFNVIMLIIVLIVIFKVIKMVNPESVGTVLKYAK